MFMVGAAGGCILRTRSRITMIGGGGGRRMFPCQWDMVEDEWVVGHVEVPMRYEERVSSVK